MGQTSNIQWTDATWNIARGCTKVDEDCKYCYMYRDSFDGTRCNPLDIVRTKTVFNFPLKFKETKSKVREGGPLIFTSSLTDVFHPAIDSYRHEMWDIIRKCPQHTFQILTKRPERIIEHLPEDWGDGWDNVWMGTSVGNQSAYMRILDLLKVKAKIKFLSVEPMWGLIELRNINHKICPDDSEIKPLFGNNQWFDVLQGHMANGQFGYDCPKLDWVIIGGESGNNTGKYRYRSCELAWIEKIISDCKEAKVSVFVKQLGTYLAKQLGLKDRHGGNIDEWPEYLQIREFPTIQPTAVPGA